MIDARGCIVLPGLINMHQHHWYTLFKGLADGIPAGGLGRAISAAAVAQSDAKRRCACRARRRHGDACDRHDLLAQSLGDDHDAGPGRAPRSSRSAELGIRQVYAKELRCRTPGNPRHPLSLDEALDGLRGGVAALGRRGRRPRSLRMVIESNAHWVAAGMSTEELICRGYELARKHSPAHHRRISPAEHSRWRRAFCAICARPAAPTCAI